MSKKIISYKNYWKCENMDNLAPITEEGVEVLFNDNSRELYKDIKDCKYDFANNEEINLFLHKLGFALPNDEVIVIKGRKLPIGSKHIVKDFYDYSVPGTYGHNIIRYVKFNDNKSIKLDNVRVVGFEDVSYLVEFTPDKLNVGGRIN